MKYYLIVARNEDEERPLRDKKLKTSKPIGMLY